MIWLKEGREGAYLCGRSEGGVGRGGTGFSGLVSLRELSKARAVLTVEAAMGS